MRMRGVMRVGGNEAHVVKNTGEHDIFMTATVHFPALITGICWCMLEIKQRVHIYATARGYTVSAKP